MPDKVIIIKLLSQKREEKAAYNLTVIAENSLASPKLSTAITLNVIVYDVSDHKPKFTRPRYEAEVLESAAIGTSVIQINVTNSEQVYEMKLQCVTLILPFGHVR